MSHTPGPWNIVPPGTRKTNPHMKNKTWWVESTCGIICWSVMGITDDVIEDNARLIASAPDLLSENDRLKKAILDFGKNPAGFDWAVLERIEQLEEMNKELLEACKNLVRGQLQHPTFESYVKHAVWVAEQAIAKAEGKP